MPSFITPLVQRFLLPIPDGAAVSQMHYLNPTSHFVLTLMSITCLVIACLTAGAWQATEKRRTWFETETERRRAMAQEVRDDMLRQIQEVSQEMERLRGSQHDQRASVTLDPDKGG